MEKENKFWVVLFSHEIDKVTQMSVIAATAAEFGYEVNIAFASLAVSLLDKKYVDSIYTGADKELADRFVKGLEKKGIKWYDVLKRAKETGNLHVFACEPCMSVIDMKKEDLVDFVEDTITAANLLENSKAAKIVVV